MCLSSECLSFLPFCVWVHDVPLCPDKDTTKSNDWRFPNKEKLHVLGITRNACPSLLFYITSCGFFFVRENSRGPQPNKLNMALATKRLGNTDSRSGKQLIASRRRTCKADLRSSFCYINPFCLCSVSTTVQWHNKSVCVYCVCCGSKFVRVVSRPNKVTFFP